MNFQVTGIPVGVAFDELHLLHCAAWEEVQDCPVAILRLHYEGGGSQDFEIKYGVHLSDWNRLPSEATEVLTDPDSKIVWRGEGVYGGTGRLFKTVLRNPHPERVVKSMDLFSTGTRVSYQLLAATVAKSDPQRAVTPGLPLNQPAFHFDGALKVIVLDARTGEPIPGADVYWHGLIAGQGIVAPPQLTGTNGETVIKYPVAGTEGFDIQVTKPGYNDMGYGSWTRNNNSGEMTFRLEPMSERSKDTEGMAESKEDLAQSANVRYEAATSIVFIDKRDSALSRVAIDAAKAGQVDLAAIALKDITFVDMHDSSASECALILCRKGEMTPALDIAKSIIYVDLRDETLDRIAKSDSAETLYE